MPVHSNRCYTVLNLLCWLDYCHEYRAPHSVPLVPVGPIKGRTQASVKLFYYLENPFSSVHVLSLFVRVVIMINEYLIKQIY